MKDDNNNMPLPFIVKSTIEVQTCQTMSSSQLAELLGREKKHINEAIKEMFTAEIDGRIIRPSLDSRGYVTEYHLPELESTMFVAKKDITYLRKITQFWIDQKENPFYIPENYGEALKLAGEIQTKNQLLIAQAAENKPALELGQVVGASKDSILIGDFSKKISSELGFVVGRNKFYEWLRFEGIVDRKNKPYHKYVTCGWLEMKDRIYENVNTNGPRPTTTTYVTGKGQIALYQRFKNSEYYRLFLDKKAPANKKHFQAGLF